MISGANEAAQKLAQTVRIILPIWLLFSIRACAFAASASGKTVSIKGFMRPASISGHTFSRKARASAAFSSMLRGRSVDPVSVSRFSITGRKFTSAVGRVQEGDRNDAPAGRGHLNVARYL